MPTIHPDRSHEPAAAMAKFGKKLNPDSLDAASKDS